FSRLLQNSSALYAAGVGALSVTPAPRLLSELMETVEERWKPRASSVGVALFVTYEGDPACAADIDAERLIQTFDALIARALAETRRGAVEAALGVRPAGDGGLMLQGRVRDSGRDLPPEELARIFDFTSDETADLSGRIGMALASRI